MTDETLPTVTDTPPAPAQPPTVASMLYDYMYSDRPIDADTIGKLVDLQKQIRDEEARKTFSRAMNAVQSNIRPVYRDAVNDQTRSRYAKLEKMHEQIAPVYHLHGFSLSFSEEPCPLENHKRIVGILRHCDGHTEQYTLDLSLDSVGIKGNRNKTDIHASGSTFSYGRRYLESMIFNVVFTDEDDDGQAAGAGPTVTPEQAADLIALCEDVGADAGRVIGWVQTWAPSCSSWEDVPASGYTRLVQMLERKRGAA